MLDGLIQGLHLILTVHGIGMLALGVVVGLVFGAIPGLGGTTAMALFIPLTYGMQSQDAMALAGGIMGAVAFGGTITAILLNTPGTPMSAATCFDGYPLAQQGKAGMAIGAAGMSSSLGGLFGVLILVAVMPSRARAGAVVRAGRILHDGAARPFLDRRLDRRHVPARPNFRRRRSDDGLCGL